MEQLENLKQFIEDVPGFPVDGVTFRDITPLLTHKFMETVTALEYLFREDEIARVDCFAGIDARGFVFASAIAARTGKNIAMVRKGGKLPPPVVSQDYDLEYGSAKIEMKPCVDKDHNKIIIVDDVIATGGSMTAAADLCTDAGYEVIGFACLIDLKFLNNFEWNDLKVRSVIQYHD